MDQLRAGGDLGPIGTFATLATNLVAGAGVGSYRGLSALAVRFGWPAVVSSALGATAVFHVVTTAETKRLVGSSFGRGAEITVELLAAVFAARREPQARFDELACQDPDWQLRDFPLPARGETRVRSVLRTLPGLHQPSQGRFQLGVPVQAGGALGAEFERAGVDGL